MIDPLEFRLAAGAYMTGVTVVTTLDADGNPAGLTVNSFTTVSLDPPLVLVCIEGSTVPAFEAGGGFAVHVLGANQEGLAKHFATSDIERFSGLDWSPGISGLPLLPGALATFECRLVDSFDGGDHRIYVGEVRRLTSDESSRPALGFFRGRYFSV